MGKNTEPIRRWPKDIDINLLRHAAWNPREEITPESVADITASIMAQGLIQRLVVVDDLTAEPNEDGERPYIVIAGNRRLVACRVAGMTSVPCEILGVPLTVAKRMTLIENLQRKAANPIMEAALIKELTATGMTVDEMAAGIGCSHGWICKRSRLNDLSDGWRELVDRGVRFRVEALEKIARYPEETQDAVLERLDEGDFFDSELTHEWREFRYLFESETRDLERANFDTTECLKCPQNTACQRMLFEDEDNEGNLGHCTCSECYSRKRKERNDAIIKSLGPDAVQVPNIYAIGSYSSIQSEKFSAPRYEVLGEVLIVVYVDPHEGEELKAEREAAKKKRKVEKEEAAKVQQVAEKIKTWAKDNAKAALLEMASMNRTEAIVLAYHALDLQSQCYRFYNGGGCRDEYPGGMINEMSADLLHGLCPLEDTVEAVSEEIAKLIAGGFCRPYLVYRTFESKLDGLLTMEEQAIIREDIEKTNINHAV